MESEFKLILGTHLGYLHSLDRLVWPFEKRGSYSVRYGYHWALDRSRAQGAAAPFRSNLIPKHVWKCVWKLEVPPKIRCFMWKSIHGAVATKANLFKRRCSPSPICPLCNTMVESTEHLFLQCLWVNTIWLDGSMTSGLRRGDDTSWAVWLGDVIDSTRDKCARINLLSYIVILCWYIWKSRCDFIFNQQSILPGRITAAIKGVVEAAKATHRVPVTRDPTLATDLDEATFWSPPCSGFVKINVDVSWMRSGGTCFVGVVVRDDNGGFVAAVRYSINASSVAMAEALAILLGCEFGRAMKWEKVILETDSLISVSCLRNADTMGSWEAFPILAKCRRMGESFQDLVLGPKIGQYGSRHSGGAAMQGVM